MRTPRWWRLTRARPVDRPAAVLWDMDGTIVDTEPYWIECEYELVAEFGGEWNDELALSIVGLDLRDSARVLRDSGGVDLPIDDIVNRLLDGVIERVRRSVPWRPGARELLARLSAEGVPCALVTMSWDRFAHAVVASLPPRTFATVVTGDAVMRGKPHPEPYLTAAAALGVDPTSCVAIEDSPAGVRSAVAAGCTTFAVPNAVDVAPGAGYTVVESLDDIDPRLLGLGDGRRSTGATQAVADAADDTLTSAPHAVVADDPDGDVVTGGRRWRAGGIVASSRTRSLVALVGIVAAGTAAALVVRAPGPEPLDDIAMSGWAPYWVLDSARATVAVEADLFHELSPFWFEARGVADVGFSPNVDTERIGSFLTAARRSGAAIVPSVVDAMPEGGMAAVLADPTTRRTHVETLVDLAVNNGFDGLDIDYEQFAFADDRDTWAATSPNWIAFLTELSAALRRTGLRLTVAVPPIYDSGRTDESGYWVYDYAAMAEVVDSIRIMAYDFSVAEPGPLSPLDWVRRSVRAAKKAVDDDSKIVLGVPLYGRNWVTATSGTCPEDTPGRVDPTLDEIDGLLVRYGATAIYDEPTGDEAFTYLRPSGDANRSCVQSRVVHFVGARGVRARIDIAREERIGGVVFWALGFDTPAVWEAVRDVARPRSAPTTEPTTGAPGT
ncbi:MAG: HAD-IA family hydrolase [Ilumatobacteraceae bacterium]